MPKQPVALNQFAPKIFWSMLLGTVIGSIGGFGLAFVFVKNVFCFIGALLGGALGAFQTSRILVSMLGLTEQALHKNEGITGQWIRFYWLLNSWYLLAIYGLVIGFILSALLLTFDSFNLPLLEDTATIVNAEIDQDAAYTGDTRRGLIYIVTVEYKNTKLSLHVDSSIFYGIEDQLKQKKENKDIKISYYESRLLHRLQLRTVRLISAS
jgi:hypothetical protein